MSITAYKIVGAALTVVGVITSGVGGKSFFENGEFLPMLLGLMVVGHGSAVLLLCEIATNSRRS